MPLYRGDSRHHRDATDPWRGDARGGRGCRLLPGLFGIGVSSCARLSVCWYSSRRGRRWGCLLGGLAAAGGLVSPLFACGFGAAAWTGTGGSCPGRCWSHFLSCIFFCLYSSASQRNCATTARVTTHRANTAPLRRMYPPPPSRRGRASLCLFLSLLAPVFLFFFLMFGG